MEVPDIGGDGVKMLGTPTGSFIESFIKIQLQELYQNLSIFIYKVGWMDRLTDGQTPRISNIDTYFQYICSFT